MVLSGWRSDRRSLPRWWRQRASTILLIIEWYRAFTWTIDSSVLFASFWAIAMSRSPTRVGQSNERAQWRTAITETPVARATARYDRRPPCAT